MDLKNIHIIYFIGIGGIGMSSLARYFNARGIEIHGYDRISTSLTEELASEGICIHFKEDTTAIPENVDLVIYTPAIPEDHKELLYLKSKNIPVKKRSEILGLLTKDKYTVAVAGTHGKTTISSIITHILNHSGVKTNSFIGGFMKNYNSNFIGYNDAEIFIVEADEFDRSFLTLHPDIAVISSIDTDHLDIYGSRENLKKSFETFATQIKDAGELIINNKLTGYFKNDVTIITYVADGIADYFAEGVQVVNNMFEYNIHTPDGIIRNIHFRIPGRHNIENALAGVAVCVELGIEYDEIRAGLETYMGVTRRFDIRYSNGNTIYIDDYAHHPIEISSCINAVKEMYPKKKITGVFQPHLYSRTRDLADEFARSLDQLDEVILLDIYPAREKPLKGINSDMLLKKIRIPEKMLCSKDDLLPEIEKRDIQVLLTLGAGDIDQLAEPIENLLKQKER